MKIKGKRILGTIIYFIVRRINEIWNKSKGTNKSLSCGKRRGNKEVSAFFLEKTIRSSCKDDVRKKSQYYHRAGRKAPSELDAGCTDEAKNN